MAHRHAERAQTSTRKSDSYQAPAPYTPYYSSQSSSSTAQARYDPASASRSQPKAADGGAGASTEDREAAKQRLAKEEDGLLMREAASRVAQVILADQIAAVFPDYQTPFRNSADVVQRLLPYHVFQQPEEDLWLDQNAEGSTGTANNDPNRAVRREIQETETALSLFKRKRLLEDRFRAVRARTASRPASSELQYEVHSLAVDDHRKHVSTLTAEVRAVRDALAQLEKDQRQPSSSTSFTPVGSYAQPTYPTTHRGAGAYIPYQPAASTGLEKIPISSAEIQARAQSENRATAAQGPRSQSRPSTSRLSTFGEEASSVRRSIGSPISFTSTIAAAGSATPQVPTHPIPLQIPRTALAAFDSLGILPVPATQSQSNGHTSPAAVLMGERDDGQTLDITINLSLLDSAQLSGLAAVLNLLKTNGVNLQAPRGDSMPLNGPQPSSAS